VGLIVFAILAWIIVTLYVTFPRRIRNRESVVLLSVVLVLNISATWILVEEMKWLKRTDNVPEYLAFLLYRSVIIPFIVLLFLSLLLAFRTPAAKLPVVCGYGAALFCMERLMYVYKIYSYSNAMLGFLMLYYVLLLAVAYALQKWYRKAMMR
jgi:hypothetical protein